MPPWTRGPRKCAVWTLGPIVLRMLVSYKGPVRRILWVIVLLATLGMAGCGESSSTEPAWNGPPTPGSGGKIAVKGFVDYAQSLDAAWEHSPATTAAEFLRLDERTAKHVTIDAEAASGEGGGPQTVVVTLDGLPDDSVRSERWTLVFHDSDSVYTLASATREQRCWPGRGHVAYAPGPCA